jgi:hypothetical protein
MGMNTKPKMITARQPASAFPKNGTGPKVKDNRKGTEPNRTNAVSYPPSKKTTMATRAAGNSWTTLLGFTKGGSGSYTK